MEINHRIQSKFLKEKNPLWIKYPDGSKKETNFNEVELILKDIYFIRLELAKFSYLYASQFSFGGHLDKNYWEFLNLKGEIGQKERDELEEGVLLLVYLLFSQIFEAEGKTFLIERKLIKIVQSFLNLYSTKNEKMLKLKDCIEFSMVNFKNTALYHHQASNLNLQDQKNHDQLTENDRWVYRAFVEEYFVDIANSFESGRIETRNFNEWIQKNGKI